MSQKRVTGVITRVALRRLGYLPIIALLAVALLVGVARLQPAVAQSTPQGPRVVTSTTVFADMVQQVGKDRVGSVRSIVPAGVDAEDYEPTPNDLQAVSQANLLVREMWPLFRLVSAEAIFSSARMCLRR